MFKYRLNAGKFNDFMLTMLIDTLGYERKRELTYGYKKRVS